MKATDLLEQQHDEVTKIFDQLEEAEGAEEKELFERWNLRRYREAGPAYWPRAGENWAARARR